LIPCPTIDLTKLVIWDVVAFFLGFVQTTGFDSYYILPTNSQ
jgi:hypothetical protein